MTPPAHSALPVPGRAGPAAPDGRVHGTVFALLLLALLLAYWPSLTGDFLWDDAGHVTNPTLQSWSGLARIWTEPGATQQYYPLLHSAFWVEHRLWGDAPLGYRLSNVLWHALSAWLLIALLRRLAVPGALLAGGLFALHPVAVESVAWIAEQKNTLSTVFYLLAALAWLRFQEERRPARYAIATAWFIAALLTKSVTATLPAALLVLAWWRQGRLSGRTDVLPLLPWLVIGSGSGLFTAWFERSGIGAQGAEFNVGHLERALGAARNCWFYLGKLLWPADLAFFYPRWKINVTDAADWLPLASASALVGLLVWWARRNRGPLAAGLLFGGTLFPALGFVNVYPFIFSPVADHFQYLASLAAVAAGAAGLTRLITAPALARSGGLLLIAGLAVLTWRQSAHYVDSVTLYRATLATNPDSWIAHHNLAAELAARNDPVAALPYAQRANALKPDFPDAVTTLADSLARIGRAAEALPLLERARHLHPRNAALANTSGVALVALGRREEAKVHFQRAIELQPNLTAAHYNLGLCLAELGDFPAASNAFARTSALQPDHAGAALHWGLALAANGQLSEAHPHFERALQLQPDSASTHQAYGRVLLTASLREQAVSHFRQALELDPMLPGIHRDLATTLESLGRTEEARAHAIEANRKP